MLSIGIVPTTDGASRFDGEYGAGVKCIGAPLSRADFRAHLANIGEDRGSRSASAESAVEHEPKSIVK